MSANNVVIEQWQKLVPAEDEIRDLKKLKKGKLAHHGDPQAYDLAQIPTENDPRWTLWESTDKKGVKYGWSGQSRLIGKPALEFVDFTYIQTFVDIPPDWASQTFNVVFDGVDDGARIYVFNDDHPYEQGGPQQTGSFNAENDLKLGGKQMTGDIRGLLKVGARNRLVIVQFDDAPVHNNFTGLRVEIAGSPIEPTPPPEKGRLLVVSASSPLLERSDDLDVHGEIALHDEPAIEIIFDSSGSMGQEKLLFEGEERTRDYVAKRIYHDLLDATIPRDAMFALRVFGPDLSSSGWDTTTTHLEVKGKTRDLHTTLVHALGEIELDVLKDKIEHINPDGWTPITESLEEVEADLRDAHGSRLVVLLTDGYWNGKPSPLEAVKNLKGIEFILNIVGIDLDEEHRNEFKGVAEAANGKFFSAASESEFVDAMRNAVGFEYKVFKGDDPVASGSLDGPDIELDPGTYTIRVTTSLSDANGMPQVVDTGAEVQSGMATVVVAHRT